MEQTRVYAKLLPLRPILNAKKHKTHRNLHSNIAHNHNWHIDVISSFVGADRINKSLFPSSYANKFLLIFTNITNRIQCRVEFKMQTCIEMSMTVFE